jgi:NitT/TauT family transport system substrate-binding protein
MVYNKPPFAVVGRKSHGVSDPRSLEGKHIGASPAGATFDQWPIFAKLNGIDLSKVSVESIGIPVRAPMLAAGQVDAVLGYAFRVYVDVKERGVPVEDIVRLEMADYGLKLYGSTIIVNTKFAAENPAAVTAFLTAFAKGVKETIRNPSAAVDSVLRRQDLGQKETELERLRMVIRNNVLTPEVHANGLGAIERDRLAAAIDQLALTTTFKTRPKPEDIFDPAFLPAAAERKLD